jgi:hypothetical protein
LTTKPTIKAELLEKLRSRIPESIDCPTDCGDCCTNVTWSRFEWYQIPAEIRCKIDPFSFECPFLKNRRCIVYEHRPILCRLYGVAASTPCTKGVAANHYLSAESADVIWTVYRKNFFKEVNNGEKKGEQRKGGDGKD